jgi:rhomboid protease GluP
MEIQATQPVIIEEKHLVGTMITGKLSAKAFIVASLTTILFMSVTMFYWLAPDTIADLFPAVHSQIFQHGQIWRVFSAMFVHADLEHLLSNMYMLWIFSFFVFGYFGFGIFPISSILLGAAANAMAVLTYGPTTELLGASGLVYILGGFWLTLYPLIQRQYSVANRLIRAVGIALIIFAPSTFIPTTSYITHAIGFVLGVVLGIFYFIKNKDEIRSHERYRISYVQDIYAESL